jgi:hypothetical protein
MSGKKDDVARTDEKAVVPANPDNSATERNIVISDLLLRFNFISQIILFYLLSALKYPFVLITSESILELFFHILLCISEQYQSNTTIFENSRPRLIGNNSYKVPI